MAKARSKKSTRVIALAIIGLLVLSSVAGVLSLFIGM
ncbi:flagellar basal body-associated protein FliL [Paeniclostridium ghonii]|uniref:Flagellar basal body-associated protein FliL n=1 Tax=Paraclostridium ghonii TaxID=29358 RepID=A0ABU0N3X6_9FIRM|nr:flagellar basal body-associated protein FliL [Paeniclostridium ghonii]